jgi:hypothetical protein
VKGQKYNPGSVPAAVRANKPTMQATIGTIRGRASWHQANPPTWRQQYTKSMTIPRREGLFSCLDVYKARPIEFHHVGAEWAHSVLPRQSSERLVLAGMGRAQTGETVGRKSSAQFSPQSHTFFAPSVTQDATSQSCD